MNHPSSQQTPPLVPLCVDLDGTLVATDTLWESIFLLLRKKTLLSFLLPIWLLKGRAYLKHKIAQHIKLNVTTLPYRENILEFLKREQDKGRAIILATAAHQKIAHPIAKHLRIFAEVIASDATTNVKGIVKRDILVQRFGQFDYMGDSTADIPIFKVSRYAFLVAPSRALLKKISCPPHRLFPVYPISFSTWLKLLRPHQWVKNVLIFLPLFLSHQFQDVQSLMNAFAAFLAFSMAASAGYILNDLLDLPADRSHPTKKNRPFASGKIPISYGLPLFSLLVILSLLSSVYFLSFSFAGLISSYLLLTMTYSFLLKSKMVLDVVVLAGLYTFRIFAGGIAVSVGISSWLLAFSMFMFMSLAFLKRYTELLQLSHRKFVKHRDYTVEDLEMIASMGPTNGYLAVLVFALYINSDQVGIYSSPFILWMICPPLLYWITRIWFLTHRRKMLDDPVQFALTDPTSWVTIIGIIIIMFLAKFI